MYQIVSDGSCDLDQSLMNQFHIHVVPFYITTDNEHYQKEKEDLEVHEFYQFMVDYKNFYTYPGKSGRYYMYMYYDYIFWFL